MIGSATVDKSWNFEDFEIKAFTLSAIPCTVALSGGKTLRMKTETPLLEVVFKG
jgi:hypothetical protein